MDLGRAPRGSGATQRVSLPVVGCSAAGVQPVTEMPPESTAGSPPGPVTPTQRCEPPRIGIVQLFAATAVSVYEQEPWNLRVGREIGWTPEIADEPSSIAPNRHGSTHGMFGHLNFLLCTSFILCRRESALGERIIRIYEWRLQAHLKPFICAPFPGLGKRIEQQRKDPNAGQ